MSTSTNDKRQGHIQCKFVALCQNRFFTDDHVTYEGFLKFLKLHTLHGRKLILIYDMIYLLTAIGLSPGGSNTVHIYTQTIHRTIQSKQYIEQHNYWKSAGRAPSWLVIPWHLPYNRGKSTEKPQLTII